MFWTIYKFEILSWLKRPAIYIYAAIILITSILIVAAGAGAFDSNTVTVSSLKYLNSPTGILNLVMGVSIFVFLLFPNIAGASIYKDINTGMYQVMYSFPFTKHAYFFGKFFSALTICILLTLFVGLGVFIGMFVSGVNEEVIGPHDVWPFICTYLIYTIPASFLFCALTFGVVSFTRSVVFGFIIMVAFYIFQGFLDHSMSSMEYHKVGALLDPFGEAANRFYTKYWTIDEFNTSPIPFKGLIIVNRLLWTGFGLIIILISYLAFSFQVNPNTWKPFWKRKLKIETSKYKEPSIRSVTLPTVRRRYNFSSNINSIFQMVKMDLKYILKGGPFIVISIIGLVFMALMMAFSPEIFQTKTLPTTSSIVLIPGFTYGFFITLLTFVYAGLLVDRRRATKIFQLEDTSSISNLTILFSKFFSITIMQAVLLIIPIMAGLLYQLSQGYYNIELGVYLFDAYCIKWIRYLPWTFLSLFIYSIIPNFYIGLVVCLVIGIGTTFLSSVGIEQDLFKYNRGPNAVYSDIDKFGSILPRYFYYRVYWIVLGLFLIISAALFWNRGMPAKLVSRFKKNLTLHKGNLIYGGLCLMAFVALGSFIYYQTNIIRPFYSSKQMESMQAEYEKKYSHFAEYQQPRIVDVNLQVELFTELGNFKAEGYYWLKNKSDLPIDTIFVDHINVLKSIDFNAEHSLIIKDSISNFRSYALKNSLLPKDSIRMDFLIQNDPNTIFKQDILVRKNGTFLSSSLLFPNIGYQQRGELTNKSQRTKYNLPKKDILPDVTDTSEFGNTYISNCSDWINFEITIGTAHDQIAMAPGKLISNKHKDSRRYFHYKMDKPMLNFYNISSAKYEVREDKYKDVSLTIYYHKGHEYNLDRMMNALKDGLQYYEANFSPYQFDQVRILEFPRGSFAQSFANTIPFSENVGFVAQVDDSEQGGVDYPYAITAHELAHQWWAHQVIGANVKGATMLSESLSEYSSLKVLESRYGENKMRKFLKSALDKYLLQRSFERNKELPLAFNQNQQYIHYQKGSLVFYALSDMIGDTTLNKVLSDYIEQVGFQEPPYTNSLELLALLKEATPDSLQYFIEDNFEHITLYDNRIEKVEYSMNVDSSYTGDFTAHVRKYRTNDKGKPHYKNPSGDSLSLDIKGKSKPIYSFPLKDYIDVVVFGNETKNDDNIETILYHEKVKIEQIENNFSIIVDKKPIEVGIDPFNILIDRDSNDNRRKVNMSK